MHRGGEFFGSQDAGGRGVVQRHGIHSLVLMGGFELPLGRGILVRLVMADLWLYITPNDIHTIVSPA